MMVRMKQLARRARVHKETRKAPMQSASGDGVAGLFHD